MLRAASERWKTAAIALTLFAVNALIVLRLFRTPYTQYMGSIEAAYIGLARYIGDHFPDLSWFPLWYGGIPFPDAYPPLLHFLVAGVAKGAHLSPGLAYHVVTAIVYALGPVTFFWAAWRLGAGRIPAAVTAALYSLISPTCFLVKEVRFDSGGWFGPRRLVTLLPYGEGPHLTSLLFLPLAVALLHVALEKRRPQYYVLAGLAVAATVLSNWIGAFALALFIGAYLLAGFERIWIPRWGQAVAVGIYAYAVASPFAAPSIIATIRNNAPLVGGRFESGPLHRVVAAGFLAGFLLLAWGLARQKVAPRIRFGILIVYGTSFIALSAYWLRFALLPQPQRYHLEMDLALWMAVAFIATSLSPRIVRPAAAVLLLACIPLVLHDRARARQMIQPIDIQSTAEYRVSRWLAEHEPGRRVFAPGTICFWMNAFSDTPLLNGGFDNGERNALLQHVIFQQYFGEKLQVGLDWLKAFGVDAIVGGDPSSTEVYHPYAHPEKLHGLTELWRDSTEVIYQVPRHSSSLAHVVLLKDLPTATPPGYDTKPFAAYLAALEDPSLPQAAFRWTSAGTAVITTNLRPEHLLSVQVTFDEGWNARVNGQTRRIWGDKLGQMVVEPQCNGACTVSLVYDGGTEMRIARAASVTALGGGFLWILLVQTVRRRRSDSTRMN